MSSISKTYLEKARALHAENTVVDLHNDFLLKNRFFGKDFRKKNKPQIFYTPWRTDLDLHRARAGGVHALGFALWAGRRRWSGANGRGAFAFTNDLMDRLEGFLEDDTDPMVLARSAEDIRQARKQDHLAAFVGIEGAQALEDNLENIEHFYKRGVRYIGLTWNTSPSFARSAHEAKKKRRGQKDGLTPFGKQVVGEMNRLGMMVDLAHASEQTFWDVFETCKTPPFESHTGAASVHSHFRNINDEQIRQLARAQSVIGIIFCPLFLGGLTANLDTVADHMDRIVTVGGHECLSIGSDFDGFIPLPRGMRDVSDLPMLTAKLLERGHPEKDIVGYLGNNFLRYFQRVWDESDQPSQAR